MVINSQKVNPLTRLDYPDPDVIRVGEIYYMVSTTMHFMPGCEILRSYNLIEWEHAAYVYDVLDSTPGQRLEGEQNIYGKGMWAASLRYHKGTFYVFFVANDTGKTYVYSAPGIEGPWKKGLMEGFYHDCSVLFDDDGRVYIASGNNRIRIRELKQDLSGPKEGGLDRVVVTDEGHPGLGYEGCHFYKIKGKYYLFFIHSLREEWKRVEACFVADSLEGEFCGGDVLNDDMGYCNQGVAQGGIVDTPEGDWYAVLFQDRGAVGRIPVLLPVGWDGGVPVFGREGRVPAEFEVRSSHPDYAHRPLVESDDFMGGCEPGTEVRASERVVRHPAYDSFGFKSCWQFNHEPDLSLIKRNLQLGTVEVITGKLCEELTGAQNVLTQRMRFPKCAGQVTLDATRLKDGDVAGLCAFQGDYGMVAVTRRGEKIFLVMKSRTAGNTLLQEEAELHTERVRLKAEVDFTLMKDEAAFYYDDGAGWKGIGGVHKLRFKLDHFTGCRFGLFVYATKEVGGSAIFSEFEYK